MLAEEHLESLNQDNYYAKSRRFINKDVIMFGSLRLDEMEITDKNYKDVVISIDGHFLLTNQLKETEDYFKSAALNNILEAYFTKALSLKIPEPPDVLLCPLTLELMDAPTLLLPTGSIVNYASAIELQENGGSKDPLTMEHFEAIKELSSLTSLISKLKQEKQTDISQLELGENLLQALKNNNEDTAIALIDLGAPLNHPSQKGRTPLELAIEKNMLTLITLLLQRGAALNYESLLLASGNKKWETVRVILEHNTEENDNQKKIYTNVLLEAAKDDQWEIVKLFFNKNVSLFAAYNGTNQHNWTLVDFAVCYQHKSMIKELLELGMQPSDITRKTALQKNNAEIIALLIGINVQDIQEVNPIKDFLLLLKFSEKQIAKLTPDIKDKDIADKHAFFIQAHSYIHNILLTGEKIDFSQDNVKFAVEKLQETAQMQIYPTINKICSKVPFGLFQPEETAYTEFQEMIKSLHCQLSESIKPSRLG